MLLERRREDKVRTLATLQRVGEDLAETVLVLNDRQEPTLGASLREYDAAQLGERIITWLADHPDATEQAIIEAVEGGSAPLGRALRELLQQGKVTREGKGQRGDPYRYSPPRPAPKGLGENPETPGSPATAALKVPHARSGGPEGEQGDLSPEPDPEGLFEPDLDPDQAARDAPTGKQERQGLQQSGVPQVARGRSRSGPDLQLCQSAPAVVADHVVPIAEGGARFVIANGQGVCKSCHSRKTIIERRARGELP